MTRKTADRPRPRRTDEVPEEIYIPHPSWTRPNREPVANEVLAPGEFWAKLGL
jgi:hypothetical protein